MMALHPAFLMSVNPRRHFVRDELVMSSRFRVGTSVSHHRTRQAMVHHFSYVRPTQASLRRKITTWGHSEDYVYAAEKGERSQVVDEEFIKGAAQGKTVTFTQPRVMLPRSILLFEGE
jgi:hypothetical protein